MYTIYMAESKKKYVCLQNIKKEIVLKACSLYEHKEVNY